MASDLLICPVCDGPVSIYKMQASAEIECPGCRSRLTVARSYYVMMSWIGWAVSAGFVWLLRPVFDLFFAFAIVVAWLPIAAGLTTLARRPFPPRLELAEGALAEYLHNQHPSDD
jgi:uncharacterized paraquat-inducible protein A